MRQAIGPNNVIKIYKIEERTYFCSTYSFGKLFDDFKSSVSCESLLSSSSAMLTWLHVNMVASMFWDKRSINKMYDLKYQNKCSHK